MMSDQTIEEQKRIYSREVAAHTLRQWNLVHGIHEESGESTVRISNRDMNRGGAEERRDQSQNEGQKMFF